MTHYKDCGYWTYDSLKRLWLLDIWLIEKTVVIENMTHYKDSGYLHITHYKDCGYGHMTHYKDCGYWTYDSL